MQPRHKKPNGHNVLRPKKSWTLRKTLSRNPTVRPIEEGDLRYAWAAYKQGAFNELIENRDLGAQAFSELFAEWVTSNLDGYWTVLTHTKKGYIPSGMFFGQLHPMGVMMVISGAAWFPWATPRNIVEGTVKFLNDIKNDIHVMFYAKPHQKRLYEGVAQHGIVRRIGTSHSLWPDGEKATVFETREMK